MLPRQQTLLDKFPMRIMMGAHNNKVNQLVGEEPVGFSVVLGLREVDGAVSPARRLRRVAGRGRALKDGIELELRVREDVWKVEAFRGKPVADDSNFDWGHVFKLSPLAERDGNLNNWR